jgi:hypothetical protein
MIASLELGFRIYIYQINCLRDVRPDENIIPCRYKSHYPVHHTAAYSNSNNIWPEFRRIVDVPNAEGIDKNR